MSPEVSLRVGTKDNRLGTSGKTLARNAWLNLAGRVIPLLVGVGAMPFIVRGLGPDRFGVLGIVWVLFNYFSLCDLGLGRATTKFLAESLAEHKFSQIAELVWTSLFAQIALGIAGGALLWAIATVLAEHALKIPVPLQAETKTTLYVLAVSLPVILANNGLRAVLEGCQRFDLANLLAIPASALVFLIPVLSLPFGFGLPAIVSLLLVSRLFFAGAHLFFCRKALPELKNPFRFRHTSIVSMLTYGGWITVGNFVNGFLLYLDRLLIASLLPVALVGYYTAPFEAVTKLWLIPASLATTIFPACSALASDAPKLQDLYSRSIKYLFVVLGPIMLFLVVFAKDILGFWLGPEFALRSALVLQILAVGVFLNCFAYIPHCFLQGLGRPDTTAKLFLMELPLYALLAWCMVRDYGIAGAAAAWSLRVGVEVLILLILARKLFSLEPDSFGDARLRKALAAFSALAVAFCLTASLHPGLVWLEVSLIFLWVTMFAAVVWKFALDDFDRLSFLSVLAPLQRTFGYLNSSIGKGRKRFA